MTEICRKTGCTNGRLTGAIPIGQINNRFVPALARDFQAIVNRDCPTKDTCASGSTGATLLSLFDANGDGQISTAEVRDNNLVKSLLAPDVDLVRANGKPGHDGVDDALSFGIGFTARSATIR